MRLLPAVAHRMHYGIARKESKVSVIIPCRNYGRFLGAAIESALSQTHKCIETIVVDYGSTDDTPEIAERYSGVRILQRPNRGLSVARNEGLKVCEGEFVVFLDADDLLVQDAVETSLACIQQSPESAFAYGHEAYFTQQGPMPAKGLSAGKCLKGDAYGQMLRANNPIRAPGAMLYRRDLLQKIGGFAPGLDGAADLDLNFRLVREHSIVCNDRVVLLTRVHDANMSRSKWAHMLTQVVKAQKRQCGYIRAHPKYKSDYEAGLRLARTYWGGHVLRQIAEDRKANLTDLIALTRHYPRGMVELVARAVRLFIRTSKPAGGH